MKITNAIAQSVAQKTIVTLSNITENERKSLVALATDFVSAKGSKGTYGYWWGESNGAPWRIHTTERK